MTKPPRISGRECVRVVNKIGFYIARQSGSHIILRRDEPFGRVTVPNHRELDKGTLKAIINQAGLTVEEFLKLL